MQVQSKNKLKIIYAMILASLVLSGCGSVQTRSGGITESTGVTISGQSIVGFTVYVDETSIGEIKESNLERFQMGLLGVKNTAEEDMQRITIPLKPGFHDVKVSDRGVTVLSTRILLSAGQSKELILEK